MNNKRIDIELMRIVASFFVIFNHTSNTGFFLFSLYDPRSVQYWIYLFISIFCKMSVPLFFMIAGALLLNQEDETIKKLWIHRVLHISFILAVWSFFYYMVEVKKGNVDFNVLRFLGRLCVSEWNYSYWYLYTYIAFLISLPFIRRFAQNLTDKEYVYMYLVYSIFHMIIPCIQYLLFQGKYSFNSNVSFGWLSSTIVIYPLTGYFLSFRKRDIWDGKKILILWAINIITIMISSYLTYYRAKIMGICDEGNSQAFHNIFVLINSIAVFTTCQYMNEHSRIIRKLVKPIESLGECTLGIYLLHVYIKDDSGLGDCLAHIFLDMMNVPPILYAFILCVGVFLCSYIITVILKQIPILRRLV